MSDPHLNGEQTTRWNTNMLWKVAITVGVMMASAALVLQIVLFNRVSDDAIQTKNALCSFHDDLGDRIAQTRQFLAHPETAPSFNDKQTLALIAQQLDNQIRTYQSLKGLDCQQDVTAHTPSAPPGAILAP